MNDCKLDHLVVAAANLETGCEYIENLMGVRMEAGGRHESMGTHNRLLRLGVDQYLEVIAVDPDGARPDRPRWFALDTPEMQARIQAEPVLVTWVARCEAIDESAARPPYDNMEVRSMARGDLRWRMTFTPQGALVYDGVLPLLIEWQTTPAPPQRLPESGCALSRLVVQSPHAPEVEQVLRELGIRGVGVDYAVRSGLAVVVNTPARGEVVMSSSDGAAS